MSVAPLYRQARPHTELLRRYRVYCSQQRFRVSASISIALFLVATLIVQPFANDFATDSASNPVTDIVLSNTPVYNVAWFFVYGMFLLVAFVTLLLLAHPKRIPFTLHSLTLFILIRSVFVSLTHLGPFVTQAANNFSPAITRVFFGADFFFSGHTGAPFLLALIYWHEPRLRYLFLAWSGFFAAVVLLGHLHYTIDVLSAFFITYSIYHIALWLFPADFAMFKEDERAHPERLSL